MKYGKTELEKYYEEIQQCRDIVKEVLDFGITEEQKINIIYLFSLELENRESMLELSNIAKAIKDGTLEKKEEKKLISLD
jgi:hypothetical protein